MSSPTELATLIGVGGVVTLDPPGKEFQGPLVIRRPVTINGQGGTIWAEKGPVLVIESVGVVLSELNVEVTGTEDRLSGEEACAILARSTPPTLSRVAVRGLVTGIVGEEGEWRYPRIVRLNKVKAGAVHTFTLRLVVPVACRMDSLISGVTVAPAELPAGQIEVVIRLEPMSEGIRLRGLLLLSTGRLTRRVELSGHVSASGSDVTTGTGQIVYQPADWGQLPAAPTPTLPSQPVPPTNKQPATKKPNPSPVPYANRTPTVPASGGTIDLSDYIDTPPTPTPPPPPGALPPPSAVPAASQKSKSRYRSVDSPNGGGLFGASPTPTNTPDTTDAAQPPNESVPSEIPPVPPEAPPVLNSGSDPLKKGGRRKINRLPGLFGDCPPADD